MATSFPKTLSVILNSFIHNHICFLTILLSLVGQGSIVKHVHIQQLVPTINTAISVYIPLQDPKPVGAVVELGSLSLSAFETARGHSQMYPLASFKLGTLNVPPNTGHLWINDSFIIHHVNSPYVSWILKEYADSNVLPNFIL